MVVLKSILNGNRIINPNLPWPPWIPASLSRHGLVVNSDHYVTYYKNIPEGIAEGIEAQEREDSVSWIKTNYSLKVLT